MNKSLPIYELVLDDDCLGLYTVSLVKNPATETSWFAFNKQEKEEPIKCSILEDGEQRRVLAVIARADFPFYRYINGFEFYAMFTKETIQKMAQKFLKDGYQGLINVEHQENSYIKGVEMTQLYIKDTEKGISPKGFEQIEDGSLFAEYKIESDEVWEAIKAGIFTSVSLEGYFTPKETDIEFMMEEEPIDAMDEFLRKLDLL